ncbi:hypothetical protein [Vibrio campbellii]|uniref:hypothetical protein n=1 Tax=Vibrio campbellii TaxID=680 RepID=UPI00210B98E6|nr:hypothetical protein [Vibrio campbellii]UTZ44631.1 hypothetical protein HB764_25545 [Vibrio campbellii]
MADTSMRLNLVMGMVDKLTGPIQKVTTQTTKAGERIKATEAELKKLGGMSKDIEHFRKLKTQSQQTSAELEKAQARVARLASEMKSAEKPTAKMTREFNAAQKAAGKLKSQHEAEAANYRKCAAISSKPCFHQKLERCDQQNPQRNEKYNAQLKSQQQHLDEVAERQTVWPSYPNAIATCERPPSAIASAWVQPSTG